MLHVHHADRADHLVAALADVLRVPPADPFQRDVVAVHSRGIERWVAQQLSLTLGAGDGRRDGIAANLDFPFPGTLVDEVVAAATGGDAPADPWRPARSTWPLLAVVDRAVRDGDDELLGPLRVHVAERDGRRSDRRFAAVRRVADLFDRYAVHRPEMVRAWARGEDVDGLGEPLPGRWRWQPRLWRTLAAELGVPSGADRLATAIEGLTRGRDADGAPLELDLPDRLAVFGITALPRTSLEVLAALATGRTPQHPDGRDVHLFLLHPSPALWRRVDEHLTAAPGGGPRLLAREHDRTRELPRDPLLAAWGRDARELQLVARSVLATTHDLADVAAPLPVPPTLLQRLQHAVRHDLDRPAPDDPRPRLDAEDRSVQLHRCHGRARQVEVLRDVLLHLLAEAPDLEPRDVVVLCPDIEAFAPLVEAVFGRHAVTASDEAEDTAPELRVQLADRSLRHTNPVLRVVAEVLDLADGRIGGSAVLDLCTRAPVRRRFGFDEDDLGQLETWSRSTGIRWGLDGDHRTRRRVPTEANTWRSGLDRLLVGVAVADERLHTVAGVTPEDDVEGDAVDLAGRFAELLARLDAIVGTMATPQPLTAWLEAIDAAARQLCLVDADDRWQEVQLASVLGEVADAARDVSGADLPLSLTEVRDLLADRLRGAPSRAAHRTGDLTVCTLVPMRSVPHEVVVLLGMDDEVFPRRTVPDGDDLLAAAPAIGDRDPRTEDRQLLLDAVLSARRQLVVLTTGHDERTNEERPPAVPIGELLDVVDRTVDTAAPADPDDPDGPRMRASTAITVEHPLHPFDPRRFTPGRLGPTGRPATAPDVPFGFDPNDLRAARALVGPRSEPAPFLPDRLAPHEEHGAVALRDLVAFLQHPIQALLDQRLDVRYGRDAATWSDAVPVELSGLEGWGVGDRLLRQVLAGRDPDRWYEVERARGTLPPGDLAEDGLAEVRRTVDEVVDAAADLGLTLTGDAQAIPVDVRLPGDRRLLGAVTVVGDCRLQVTYSRLARKHRLAAWVELLALTATAPERPWRAVTLGRGRYGIKVDGEQAAATVATIAPGPPRWLGSRNKGRTVDNPLGDRDATPEDRRRCAIELLSQLVELRDRGLCGPLLLPCDTAGAHAETAFGAELGVHRRSPAVAARGEWTRDGFGAAPGEDQDHAHRLVLGTPTADELLDLPPEPDEDGDGWDTDEPSRLGRLGRRVWWPLLAAEEVVDR